MYFGCVLICFNACRTDHSNEINNTQREIVQVETDAAEVTTSENPQKPIDDTCIGRNEICSVHFYLENSGSMKGYIRNDTQYKERLLNLVSSLNKKTNYGENLSTSLIASDIEYKTFDEFSKLLIDRSDRLWSGGTSEIHKMLAQIYEASDSNDLSVFITDGILSLKDSAEMESVAFQITNAVNRYVDQYAIKIMAFKSDFSARYYYNQKSARPFSTGTMQERPYYMFVIGKTDLIYQFEEKMQGLIDPLEHLEIGFKYPSVEGNIHPTSCLEGYRHWGQKDKLELPKNEPSYSFAIAADLSDFPDQFISKEYIQEHFSISRNEEELEVNLKVVDVKKDKPSEWLNRFVYNKTKYSAYTHMIGLTMNDVRCQDFNALNISLNQSVNNWIDTWHSDTDLNITTDFNKTVGFKYIIDGLKNAYGDPSKPLNILEYSIKTDCQ